MFSLDTLEIEEEAGKKSLKRVLWFAELQLKKKCIVLFTVYRTDAGAGQEEQYGRVRQAPVRPHGPPQPQVLTNV